MSGPLLAHADPVEHAVIGVAAAVAIAAYGAVWLRHPAPSIWRLASWIAGVGVVVVASSSWMESVAERTFTGHMVQHLLVIVVAAPLLVVAEPWRAATRTLRVPSTRTSRRALARWHRGAPLAALVLFVAVLFVSHLTSIYDRSLHDRVLHEGEHLAYLVSAVVLWTTVRASGRAGAPARVGAVFGVMAASAVLGLILMSARDPLMPTYAARLGIGPAIDDQRTAAAIMWVGGMLATTPLLVLAFWRWASTEDAIARRAEALADAVMAVPSADTTTPHPDLGTDLGDSREESCPDGPVRRIVPRSAR